MTDTKHNQNLKYAPLLPRLAIADLVYSIIGCSQEKRSNVLDRLGYLNKGKAARRFDALLETGAVSPNLVKYLPQALGIEPHIFVEIAYKNRPRSLFSSWGINSKELRHIEVPAGLHLESQAIQVEAVGRLISEFEGSESYKAGLELFSGPESYTYYPSYKQGWKFTVDGDFVGKMEE